MRAISNCRSVKLVVVISQRKIGHRFDGIKKIAKIVSNMVNDYKSLEKDGAVEFIFNKFDNQEDLREFPNAIKYILNSLNP